MKKLELKCWVIFYAFLFLCFFISGCKSTKVKIEEESVKTENVKQEESVVIKRDTIVVKSQDYELQEKTLKEIISSLNVNFKGENDTDKLLFKLQKTIDGMQLEVSGKGSADISQNESLMQETFIKELIRLNDSIYASQSENITFYFDSEYEKLEKRKEVIKSQLKSYLTWVFIGVILALVLFLWIRKKFF
jgi:hypothetical protein